METNLKVFTPNKRLTYTFNQEDLRGHFIKLIQDQNGLVIVSLTIIFFFAVMIEFIIGCKIEGFHLMVDSLHNILNVLALVSSLAAMVFAKMPPNERFTYGYLRLEIISAFATCCFLAFLCLFLVFRAIHDFLEVFNEKGEHNHSTGFQNFDLLVIFNGIRLCAYITGCIALRRFSALYPQQESSSFSAFKTKLFNIFSQKNPKKNEGIGKLPKAFVSSNYVNLHTIYLHFLIGSLITSTFVCLHSIEFLHQSNIEIFLALAMLFYSIKRVAPVLSLATSVLLQGLPVTHETEITRLLDQISCINGIVQIDKARYWSLTPQNNVIYLDLSISSPAVKSSVDKEVKKLLKGYFTEILIQVNSGIM